MRPPDFLRRIDTGGLGVARRHVTLVSAGGDGRGRAPDLLQSVDALLAGTGPVTLDESDAGRFPGGLPADPGPMPPAWRVWPAPGRCWATPCRGGGELIPDRLLSPPENSTDIGNAAARR